MFKAGSRNLIIRVEPAFHERLSRYAERRGTSVAELVRPLLERLVSGGRREKRT
jgi:predicted HicB family RNase H-like nuclease